MDAPRPPALDPAVLLYLEAQGWVVVPMRAVSPQGLESRLRPGHDQVAPPRAREWTAQGPAVPRRLLRATGAVFGVTVAELTGESRRQPIAQARRAGIFFAAHHLGYTSAQVGRIFGDRDDSTVRHAVRAMQGTLADPATAPAAEAVLVRIWERLVDGEARPAPAAAGAA